MDKFEVGQKVIFADRDGYGAIGTVVKITEKRKDVVVQFPSWTKTFRGDGINRQSDTWHRSWIEPLTQEIVEELNHKNKAAKCGKLLNAVYKKVDNLTDEQLDKIISVLSEIK